MFIEEALSTVLFFAPREKCLFICKASPLPMNVSCKCLPILDIRNHLTIRNQVFLEYKLTETWIIHLLG